MKINLISNDQVWLDALEISLDLLLDCELSVFKQLCRDAECSIRNAGRDGILLIDSGIPGLDYWELASWFGREVNSKAIIFMDEDSYSLLAEKMVQCGCFAVLDKRKGLAACWQAICLATKDARYKEREVASPFAQLSKPEQVLVSDLLCHDIGQLTEKKGISQQALNKRKLSIYRKLNISTVPKDKTFRTLAKLFDIL